MHHYSMTSIFLSCRKQYLGHFKWPALKSSRGKLCEAAGNPPPPSYSLRSPFPGNPLSFLQYQILLSEHSKLKYLVFNPFHENYIR
jgi:hypothetical protein